MSFILLTLCPAIFARLFSYGSLQVFLYSCIKIQSSANRDNLTPSWFGYPLISSHISNNVLHMNDQSGQPAQGRLSSCSESMMEKQGFLDLSISQGAKLLKLGYSAASWGYRRMDETAWQFPEVSVLGTEPLICFPSIC